MGVDIIIPIYNAFDDLKICLESLYRNTDLNTNHLILINDNSPDDRIKPFLEQQKRENVIVINNTENKGFSNNINLGMSQSSDRDVILLNSDTILTAHWIEKMVACAYSNCSIGTVTPLSNNATLCSVPEFCQENVLPEDLSVDEMAEIVEQCSMKKYPRITVAHGFCMLIKREVIDCIGNFDAETFQRGYGEENDFCNRAEQMGYIHVMCDDTYIYHSGTKSFISKEKEAYIREHDRILRERYPVQMHNNDVYCRDNPNAWVSNNIRYHMDIQNGNKNVLYLLQADFKEGAEDNVGGTQLHVKHLTENLRNHMNIFVAARDKDYLQLTAYISDKTYTFRFFIGDKEAFPVLQRRELADIFKEILIGFKIDLVHVHHTATTSLDIFYEANKLNIPVVFTIHDFYYVCPRIKMLDDKGNVCIDQENPDCKKCLKNALGLIANNTYLSHWRQAHQEVLCMCSCIVAPSESAKNIFCGYYPDVASKVQVIEHGMDPFSFLDIDTNEFIYTDQLVWKIEQVDLQERCPRVVGIAYMKDAPDIQHKVILEVSSADGHKTLIPTNFGRNLDVLHTENRFYAYLPNSLWEDGDFELSVILQIDGKNYKNHCDSYKIKHLSFQRKSNFRVAFIGGLNEEKGSSAVTEIIQKGAPDVEWYVFGGIGDEKLFHLKQNNLVKTAYYYQEDLGALLKYHNIDVVCILSKWPETFSYTLSEASVCRIPVIVTEIGALGQRTLSHSYGQTVCNDVVKTVKETIDIINHWKDKGTTYQTILAKCEDASLKNVAGMAKEYVELYTHLFREHNMPNPTITELEQLYHAHSLGMNLYEGEQALLDRIQELQNRLNVIDNSMTFKIVLKLTSLNIPFKKQLRKLFKR